MKHLQIFEDWNPSASMEREVVVSVPYHDGVVRYGGVLKKAPDGSDLFIPLEFECDSSMDYHRSSSLHRHFLAAKGQAKPIFARSSTTSIDRMPLPIGTPIGSLYIGGNLSVGEEGALIQDRV